MPGLGQVDWFTQNLMQHWSMLDYRATNNAISKLSEEEYKELKRLYFRGFATSDTKEADLGARQKLDTELFKMGLLG